MNTSGLNASWGGPGHRSIFHPAGVVQHGVSECAQQLWRMHKRPWKAAEIDSKCDKALWCALD